MATQVGAAYVEIGARIQGLEKGLKSASAQVEGFAGAADRSSARIGARFQALGSRMTSVGRKMTLGMTLPLAGIGVAAFKAAADFEKSMSKITGLVGISRTEVAKMRKGVLELSKGTGKSASELADGLFVVTSAGLRGSAAMDALKAASKASAAGLGQTNDIARAVAGSINAYGSSVLDAAKATDIIVATARAGNFETSQFAGALGRVLPFAKQAGASLEQVGGAVALLTRTNGNAAESITQITALMRAFVVPAEEGKKILKGVGLSAQDMRDSISKDGLAAALTMLDDKLGGNREALGRVLGSTEAAGAAFQILDADAQALNDTFGVVGKSAGMTDDAFAAAADTAQLKMQAAMTAMQAALIEVGGAIAPVVTKIAGGISSIVGAFTSLPGPVKTAAVAMATFVAAMGPILWMGGKVLGSIGAIKVAMAGMGAASAGTAAMGTAAGGAATKVGMLGAALPMLANPLGLTVAAVGLGIGALVMFRNTASATARQLEGITASTNTYKTAVGAINTEFRAQVSAIGAMNASNTAASTARAAHTAAVNAYNTALAKGRQAGESQAQFLTRLSGLNVRAAQTGVASTTATNQNTEATRKAVDGALKLTAGITNESKASQERIERAKNMVTMHQRLGASSETQRKAQAELSAATAEGNLVEARRVGRLKEARTAQIATREAIKNSSASDAEKSKTVNLLNREISRTTTELKNVQKTPDPKKKINVDSAEAIGKLDTIDSKLNALDGKTVNPFVNVIERIVKASGGGNNYRGGYIQGFASGGQVRGPGGRDKVPAMLTRGEVVLTNAQQAMVDRGISIRDAIRRTGGAFARGGTVGGQLKAARANETRTKNALEAAKKGKDKARIRRAQTAYNNAKKAREQLESQQQELRRMAERAGTAYVQMGLADFDAKAAAGLRNLEKTFVGTGAVAGKTFAQLDTDLAANLKSIQANFVGTGALAGKTFKQMEKDMRAAQKALNATFDALTPAEQRIKDMQDAATQGDLAGALSAAQAELAEANMYGDTEGAAAAQKKLAEAERAILLAELSKTAEAERAQREEQREVAQDAFNEEWEAKRDALQEQLDGQLEAERLAGENRKALLQEQLDERLAAQQATDAMERVAREHALQDEADKLASRTSLLRGNIKDVLGRMTSFARRLEVKGKDIGTALSQGLVAAGAVVRTEAAGLARIIAQYLETRSPTELGPMSNLDTWWAGMAPALVGGIDAGAMEAGIAKAAAMEGTVALSGSRMSASRAGSVINLTVTDGTLSGMSREQADRVAREIKAALDRQVRIAA